MQRITAIFKDSAEELKNVRSLCMTAMLMALSSVLTLVSTINIGPYIHIGLSWIPQAMISILFGPVTGAIAAGALDLINYFIRPDGGFFPGFTICAMIGALIYGLLLYKRKLSLVRIFVTKGIVDLFCNIIINTLCLSILYGQAFKVLFLPRVIKNVITWPIYSVMLFVVLTALDKARVRRAAF
ncbi:MAG: folate family ECF transporter S component [Lachnospiraceae bacterium]|nr:folate family ECF transporter S component [Lachnospiraceae bacterium]